MRARMNGPWMDRIMDRLFCWFHVKCASSVRQLALWLHRRGDRRDSYARIICVCDFIIERKGRLTRPELDDLLRHITRR